MTTFQKVIKYLAIAFAVFLIVSIVSGILFAVNGLAFVLGLRENDWKANIETSEKYEVITPNMETSSGTTATNVDMNSEIGTEKSIIAVLDIKLKSSSLIIKKGETLKAETNNSNILCKQNGNQLIIKENGNGWFSGNKQNKLIVYIPEDLNFNDIDIETGAGSVHIEKLNTRKLSLEIGAGKVEIENLNVSNEANITGGAGQITISSGEMKNLDLNVGIGEAIISSKLTGNNKIDAGVGSLKIDLTDDISNYTIKADKGIGSIKLEGKEVSSNVTYGTGNTYIDIDGGVGSIVIK